MVRPHYDTRHTSFQQSHYNLQTPYSRKSRFNKKMLRALQCHNAYVVKNDIVEYMKKVNVTTPEDCIAAIANYPISRNTRRPYMNVVHYWKAIGKKMPVIDQSDIKKLLRDFDEIFFAWKRLGMSKPQFPYSYLMRKIVTQVSTYGPEMHKLIRFLRILKCPKRRIRYDHLFKQCLANVRLMRKCDMYGINDNRQDRIQQLIEAVNHSIT